MKCPNCQNEEIQKEDNFCIICGTKLKKTCKCWVNKKDNYDCGESSCPGYGLFKLEKRREVVETIRTKKWDCVLRWRKGSMCKEI